MRFAKGGAGVVGLGLEVEIRSALSEDLDAANGGVSSDVIVQGQCAAAWGGSGLAGWADTRGAEVDDSASALPAISWSDPAKTLPRPSTATLVLNSSPLATETVVGLIGMLPSTARISCTELLAESAA